MRARLLVIGIVAVVGSIGLGVAASARAPGAADAPRPAATCSLPGTIPCTVDPECVAYDAVCDTQAGVCVCAAPDLGIDLGGVADLAGADLAHAVDGGGGGSSSAGPVTGGGMVSPPRTGCSFVPGAR